MSPTRTGYIIPALGAWRINADGTGAIYESYDNVPTSVGTIYVHWRAYEYGITYVLNGGTNAPGCPSTYTINSTLSIANPTRTNYTFSGWTAEYTDGKPPLTTPSTSYSIPAGTTGVVTLSANWTADRYTVTYNLDGGTQQAGTWNSYTYGAGLTLPTAPTKDNHTFAGWYDDAGLAGTMVMAIPSTATGAIELWAKWTAATAVSPTTYAVTINGSYAGTSGAGNYAAGDTVTINAGTRSGYTFSGWTTASAGVTFANANSATTTFTMPADAVTVTATYKAIVAPPTTYAVTINGSYAGTSGAGNYAEGDTVTINAGTRSGYTFSGWTTASAGVTFANANSATTTFTMPANAVTVTATYKAIMAPPPTYTDATIHADPTLTVTVKDTPLIQYPVLTHFGIWTGSGTSAGKVDADHTQFVKLTKDGLELHSSNYTITQGSTIITLKEGYLKTLSNGVHEFTTHFNGGYSETIKLTVNVQDDNIKSPKTGDDTNMIGWWLVMLGAVLVAILSILVDIDRGNSYNVK